MYVIRGANPPPPPNRAQRLTQCENTPQNVCYSPQTKKLILASGPYRGVMKKSKTAFYTILASKTCV